MSEEKRLSEGQEKFMDLIRQGKSVFLTGKAGSGKSFIVKKAMEELNSYSSGVVAVAPTGVAAQNIGGATIHSMFSLSIDGVLDYNKCRFIHPVKKRVLAKTKTIIIDEVSMLRPDILDAMNWTLIKNGMRALNQYQVIFVGDMGQLQPVVDDNMKSVLLQKYEDIYFQNSKIFNKIKPEPVELEKIHRQSDPDFIDSLNLVRDNIKAPYFKKFFADKPSGVVLAPHITTVKKYNEKGLEENPNPIITFKAIIKGKINSKDFNIDETIKVKDGCKIMYLVNQGSLVNGTIGIFRERKGSYFIDVKGTWFRLEYHSFEKKEYYFNEDKGKLMLRKVASIKQIPIKLAFALTIHKSQGLTFDDVTIDLTRKCFSDGQLYVALSRATGPEALKIIM